MSDGLEERMRGLLKEAFPPSGMGSDEKDLWPAMQSRMRGARVPFSKLDWLLVAALVGALLLFPGLIPGFLYHL